MNEVTIIPVVFTAGEFPTGNVNLHLGYIPDYVEAYNIDGSDLTTMQWWAGGKLIKSQPGVTAFTAGVTKHAITTSAIKAYTGGTGAVGLTLAFTADTDLFETGQQVMVHIFRNGQGAPGTAVIGVVT